MADWQTFSKTIVNLEETLDGLEHDIEKLTGKLLEHSERIAMLEGAVKSTRVEAENAARKVTEKYQADVVAAVTKLEIYLPMLQNQTQKVQQHPQLTSVANSDDGA